MAFLIQRPRRLRLDGRLRTMIREFRVFPENLIYPLFVVENLHHPREIQAMPGQFQWPVAKIHEPIEAAMNSGIIAFMLFGVPAGKDAAASAATTADSVVCKAIAHIRKHCPTAYIITDVCLCAYTDHGHCGLVNAAGQVDNDPSLDRISAMALAHVKAGADMVAPSDMMDGRIGAIRTLLDDNDFTQVPIMSYSAKYASAFYGPFREAAGSAPGKGDRRGYQMDYAVARDAIVEFELDLKEGADILMVKPGLAYLDILKTARDNFSCPLAVYQVSGEYSMIKAAAANGWINERQVVIESLTAMKRAGADLILSYFAPQVAEWLKEENC